VSWYLKRRREEEESENDGAIEREEMSAETDGVAVNGAPSIEEIGGVKKMKIETESL
jgi:hypothetical protein